MKIFRNTLCAIALCLSPVTAIADAPILSAPDAQARMAAEDLVVLDIRTPQEWAETGVAKGAWPVSMHRPDFAQKLQNILAKYPAEKIALICATGGRTQYVTQILEKNGIVGISDLSEGMMGNQRGPGWIARNLPVVTAEEATAAYEAAISN